MNKIILTILAAEIGAQYGKWIKQLEPVGPNSEDLFVGMSR